MTLTPQGYKRNSYEQYLEILQQEARERFGDDINLNDDSTLGKFIKLLAYKDSKIDEKIESVYNSGSIDNATNISLDYEAKKLGLSRRPAQASRVTMKVVGTPGTTIPTGYIVSTEDGRLPFVSTDSFILDAAGEGTGLFECTIKGIDGNLPANTIQTIRTAIVGVTSVTNITPSTGGLARETDSQFRARYYESLSLGGGSSTDSLRAAIFELPGVIDVTIDENIEDVTVDDIPPHSIAPFVYGGQTESIAEVVLKYKAAGIRSHGAINTTLYDSQGKPKVIGITRPTIMEVDVRFTITTDINFPADGNQQIIGRTVQYIGGFFVDQDYPGLGLGEDIVEFKVIGAIASIPGILSASVEFSTDNGSTWFTGSVPVPPNKVAKTNDDDVVVIG